jgi:2-amino-4-hydroxy-6-hydroxymethyldihydropteridine diphosphokinase
MGDRRGNMETSIAMLRERGVEVVASSSVWETEPVGEILDQPDFLNACLEVRSDLEPLELLDLVKQIELDLGRDPNGPRHGPRPLDIDLLLMEDTTFEHERLDLPHREVMSRRFVMVPLLEIDPELVTSTGIRIADALEALGDVPDQRVRVAGPPLI